MNLWMVFRIAFISLNRNKTRSFLTALGIIIGVASVISMVGLSHGAYISVQTQISKMGTSLIIVMPGSSSRGGFMGGMGSLTNLSEEDAEAILAECPSVDYVTPAVRSSGQAVYASQNWGTSVMGVGADFLKIRNWNLESGRFFDEKEIRSGSKICVLGKTVATSLFGDTDPIGKVIRFKKMPMEVVGVLCQRGESGMGQDQDDLIVMPLRTVQRKLMGITHINLILISAKSDELVESAKTEITDLLRRRHKIGKRDADDFQIRTQADMAEMAGSTLAIISFLLGSIASISLLVGGIGIMNIMLVSVTERTREIGIRMAIGARRFDILTQFLVEAMTLSGVGGTIGILLGIGITHLITRFSEWPTIVSMPAVVIAFIFSAFVGIVFGLYPAWKASRLDPIEALRFE